MRAPFAIAGILLLTHALGAAPQDPPNLIRNGDVQAGTDQPAEWGHTAGAPTVTFEWSRARGDARALRTSSTNASDRIPHNWHQRVELPEPRPERLELRARIRTKSMAPGASACVMIQLLGANRRMVGGAWSDKVNEDSDWRDVASVFAVPPTCDHLRVLAYLVGGGEVWFDDLSLKATDKPPTAAPGARSSPTRHEQLARECAQEIGWSFDAAAARARAAQLERPVLVYVRCIDRDEALASAQRRLAAEEVSFRDDGLRKDILMRAGPLSDPDLVALVNRRFVPLLLSYDLSKHGMGRGPATEDPLAAVGLSAPQAITPALAVLAPDGTVVHKLHRIGTLSTFFIERMLCECLGRIEGLAWQSPEDPLERYLDGDLEGTLELLANRRSASARILRARTLIRLGQLAEAEKAIEGLGSDEARLQRGLVHLHRGEYPQALDSIERAALPDDHPRAPQARYWAGWCERMLGEHERANASWKALVGPSLFGRKAAASLLPGGPHPVLAETPVHSAPHATLPAETELRNPGADFDWRRSIEILLPLQRADGRFGSHDPGFWDPAISSLVGRALLRWRSRMQGELAGRSDRVLKNIDAYLDAWGGNARPSSPAAFNNPYVLLYLVERGQAAQSVIAAMARSQLPDGNWSVYQAERPASFNTALHVMALASARKAGIAIPEEGLTRGADALEAMRTPTGLFPYSTKPGHEWMTTVHGSIARDPLCEHALLLAGRDTRARIAPALERFRAHCEELRLPTKKLYDYFNSRGHGGYYFFFAHLHAHEAAQLLPQGERERTLEAIRREVLKAQEFDGTWIDKTLLGRAYGTAMALLILAE